MHGHNVFKYIWSYILLSLLCFVPPHHHTYIIHIRVGQYGRRNWTPSPLFLVIHGIFTTVCDASAKLPYTPGLQSHYQIKLTWSRLKTHTGVPVVCFMPRVSYQFKKHHVANHSATTDGIEIVLLAAQYLHHVWSLESCCSRYKTHIVVNFKWLNIFYHPELVCQELRFVFLYPNPDILFVSSLFCKIGLRSELTLMYYRAVTMKSTFLKAPKLHKPKSL